MNILITGSDGFLAKNLITHLVERKKYKIMLFNRSMSDEDLEKFISQADFIFHLAGANRPVVKEDFTRDNTDLTSKVVSFIKKVGRNIPILYSSSTQAELNNDYGLSKKKAEDILLDYNRESKGTVFIYRLPSVFGKWCKPNYNSVVATFCYNIANDMDIRIDDPNKDLNLLYVDDVIADFLTRIGAPNKEIFVQINETYQIKLGELAEMIKGFHKSRDTLMIDTVGKGLCRAMYSTYVSYLPKNKFSYALPSYTDPRGTFVEMLKTENSGQFSYFTAHPGVTRGGHFHHTKTEKFLVIRGTALFRFRNLITNDFYELTTRGESPEIVDTIPGWSHDISNIGEDEMIVMLWANENFDRLNPDTYTSAVIS